MSLSDFGPEWNPLLAALAVLVVVCLLAYLHLWLGLVLLAALAVAAGLILYG